MKYRKGETIVVTEGAYSDYSIIDLFKVKRDFDFAQVVVDAGIKLELSKHILGDGHYESMGYDAQDVFIEYAVANGYIEKIKHTELHIGGYSKIEILLEDMEMAGKE